MNMSTREIIDSQPPAVPADAYRKWCTGGVVAGILVLIVWFLI